ncbi:hypothetical protein D3C81_908490 [compost metagenome]
MRVSPSRRIDRNHFPLLLRIGEAEALQAVHGDIVDDVCHGEIQQLSVAIKPAVLYGLHIHDPQDEHAKPMILMIGPNQWQKRLIALLLKAALNNRQIDFLFQFWKRHIKGNIPGDRFALDLTFGLKHVNRFAKRLVQILAIDRLQQIVHHSGMDRLTGEFKVVIPADDDRQQFGILLLHDLQKFDPIQLRHLHVDHDDIRLVLFQHRKPRLTVSRFPNLINLKVLPIPQNPNRFAKRFLVVDNQHFIHDCCPPAVSSSASPYPAYRFGCSARLLRHREVSGGYTGF